MMRRGRSRSAISDSSVRAPVIVSGNQALKSPGSPGQQLAGRDAGGDLEAVGLDADLAAGSRRLLAGGQDLDDVLVVLGGIIPDADLPGLKALGVAAVFRPGTPMQEIIDFIRRQTAIKAEASRRR